MNRGDLKEPLKGLGLDRLRWNVKAANVRRSGQPVSKHLKYVLTDPEVDNFTYDLANKEELAAWLDETCDAGRFVWELERDERLRSELDSTTRWRPRAKTPMHFGRRLGWYALVRSAQPQVVVETGIHDGLGSAALLAALEQNGHGRLISIDPRHGAGWVVPARLHRRWTVIEATSFEALAELGDIDIFVHDSLHTVEVERWELETAVAQGASMLLSDNAHALPTLHDYARDIGAAFTIWREEPLNHFYPGASLGLAWRR